MTEIRTGTEVKDEILDEVLTLDSATILARVIEGGGPVCDACSDSNMNKARTLASFTEIGRLSIADAGDRLAEFNISVCGHIGSVIMPELAEVDLVGAVAA